jgi:branched-chain amino acid transport system ATP-binding protein
VLLVVSNLEVTYSNIILALRGVSVEVGAGKVVCLLGGNGAGKSTLLKAISGLLKTELGEISEGTIYYDKVRIDGTQPEKISSMGIRQVIEGRRLYPHLTTHENLLVGAYLNKDVSDVKIRLEQVYEYFPRLADVRNNISGYLSGGEQQMLVTGRALMSRPRLLLMDEVSLGLAPLIVQEIFRIIRKINEDEHVSILLVEQNAAAALSIAEYGYVMENGRIVLDGPSQKLAGNQDIQEFYLGLSQVGERKSYKEVKHYKRRKRWLG